MKLEREDVAAVAADADAQDSTPLLTNNTAGCSPVGGLGRYVLTATDAETMRKLRRKITAHHRTARLKTRTEVEAARRRAYEDQFAQELREVDQEIDAMEAMLEAKRKALKNEEEEEERSLEELQYILAEQAEELLEARVRAAAQEDERTRMHRENEVLARQIDAKDAECAELKARILELDRDIFKVETRIGEIEWENEERMKEQAHSPVPNNSIVSPPPSEHRVATQLQAITPRSKARQQSLLQRTPPQQQHQPGFQDPSMGHDPSPFLIPIHERPQKFPRTN